MDINVSIINSSKHIPKVAKLFDEYRVFYDQQTDIQGAETYLLDHFLNKTSILIAASIQDEIIGFTQLYPNYSSVSMQKLYVLNDLFVSNNHRNKGIGALLINKAQSIAKKEGWKGLVLETGIDNPAQHLYEKLGWTKDVEYYHYSWNT